MTNVYFWCYHIANIKLVYFLEMIKMKKVISIALALVMVFALTVSASAKGSPTGKEFFKITVGFSPSDGSYGDAGTDKNKVIVDAVGDDGTVRLTANEKDYGKFSHWEIKGDYELIEGTLTDKSIVIRPNSDIDAVAYFKNTDGSTSKVPVSNNNNTSPQTGDPLYIVLGLAALAFGTGALAVKKIKE